MTTVINSRDERAVQEAMAAGSYVYVGRKRDRPLRWGNPFASRDGTLAEMVVDDPLAAHRDWLVGAAYTSFMQEERRWVLDNLWKLRGKVLGCWCAPSPCHADTLARMADALTNGQMVGRPDRDEKKKGRIYGLTVWQPWAHLIIHGSKCIENRVWPPHKNAVGNYIAIHAGKRYDDVDIERWLQAKGIDDQVPAEYDYGAIIGVVRLVACVSRIDLVPEAQWPWCAAGQKYWLLDDKVAIEPVECLGSQKLWLLDPDVLRQVRDNYKKARGVS